MRKIDFVYENFDIDTFNLKLIKNNPHKDSVKTPLILDTELDLFEIKQMLNFDVFGSI